MGIMEKKMETTTWGLGSRIWGLGSRVVSKLLYQTPFLNCVRKIFLLVASRQWMSGFVERLGFRV